MPCNLKNNGMFIAVNTGLSFPENWSGAKAVHLPVIWPPMRHMTGPVHL